MSARVDLQNSAHRPWPLPRRPWSLAMSWHDLSFLHWPVDAAALRPLIPSTLEIDTFDGTAWLGVVPFFMSGVRPRFVPALPGVSAFPEINLRTYVTGAGQAGVWFFSLDVTSRLAVQLARTAFHLPYNHARMSVSSTGDRVHYSSGRTEGEATFGFKGSYRGDGRIYRSTPGSIDAWLTERYCLFSANSRGDVYVGEIHHDPWPLESAEVDIETNSLAAAIGVELGDVPPLAHFARRLDVVAWLLKKLD